MSTVIKHMPATLKQLLALRGLGPTPSPSVSKLHALFEATSSEARQHGAHRGWLVLSTSTLVTCNVPEAVAHLYRYSSSQSTATDSTEKRAMDLNDRVARAELMREAALKCAEFIGVPRTIIGLTSLYSVLDDEVRRALRKDSLRHLNDTNVATFVEKGRALWDSVYEPHAEKLLAKLGSFHPDFPAFIIQSYGNLLAPLGSHVEGDLGRALTSVLGTAALRAEGGVGPQLTSHVFGLLKARGTPGETEEDKWLSSEEGAEWVIRTADRIIDLVRQDQQVPVKAAL